MAISTVKRPGDIFYCLKFLKSSYFLCSVLLFSSNKVNSLSKPMLSLDSSFLFVSSLSQLDKTRKELLSDSNFSKIN